MSQFPFNLWSRHSYVIIFGGSLHHVYILTLNILKNYSLFFQWRCLSSADAETQEREHKKKKKGQTHQSHTFCKDEIYARKNKNNEMTVLLLPVWVIHVWDLTRLWKSKFMHKFMLSGFTKFYQLSKYYRAMIKLKCKWWLYSSEIIKKSFNICWVILDGDTGTSWIKKVQYTWS